MDTPVTYKVAVKAYGESGWSYNSLRFPTRADAEAYGRNLAWRWTAVERWEIQESTDPVFV